MEEYGLDELAASAEAVVAGLGPLAAGLAVEASRAVTLEAMEGRVVEQGPEAAVRADSAPGSPVMHPGNHISNPP